MVILAVDYGDVRTGIAVCDKLQMLASPVTVIKQTKPEKLAAAVNEIAVQKKAQKIVVGLPKNMDGTEGFRADACREFGKMLENVSGLEVGFQDERLTTVSAHNYLNSANVRGQKRKDVVDAVSAVIILEDYLKTNSK